MGIGKMLANGFADMGANVAIVDMNMDLAKKTSTEISERANTKSFAYQCDVTDVKSVNKMVKDYASYNASKAAVIMLSKSLAIRVGKI